MRRKQNEGRGGGLNLQEKIIVALSSNYQCHFISVYAKKMWGRVGWEGGGLFPPILNSLFNVLFETMGILDIFHSEI